jgi:predicted ATPase
MITRIRIQNYRSFVDTEVKLRPFSLVVGANGSGKSNLLRAIWAAHDNYCHLYEVKSGGPSVSARFAEKHVNHSNLPTIFEAEVTDKGVFVTRDDQANLTSNWSFGKVHIYAIDAKAVSGAESIIAHPGVRLDGSGTAQVLEALKNGDREDLFEKIEESFKRYVPEVEKLSLRTVEQGKKQIQVREKGLKTLLPATELSEGTRLVLCILTILHQENPPPIILLEDIDRGLHPRLFEYVAPMMRDIAERHNINILATTHNPYLVDCFQDDKEAVIIVEKKDGASTLSTLADRLEGLDYDKEDPEDMPLGNLWFSGLVGGVPAKINRRPAK